jgi:hypothetical protein
MLEGKLDKLKDLVKGELRKVVVHFKINLFIIEHLMQELMNLDNSKAEIWNLWKLTLC